MNAYTKINDIEFAATESHGRLTGVVEQSDRDPAWVVTTLWSDRPEENDRPGGCYQQYRSDVNGL